MIRHHISLKSIERKPMCAMRMYGRRETDTMKLIVSFHNLANVLQTNSKIWEQRGFGLILVTVAAAAWKD
jgi:hypothetical protein